eukprot:2454446-Lingulodinium_polyedra.AAC.1
MMRRHSGRESNDGHARQPQALQLQHASDKDHMITFVCGKSQHIVDSWGPLLGTPLSQSSEWAPLVELEEG